MVSSRGKINLEGEYYYAQILPFKQRSAIMKHLKFDQYAAKYDAWFLENSNLLYSEAKLVAHFLRPNTKIFSVGCGSGLFESILKENFNIAIGHGIEPSTSMADIARKRGVEVNTVTAEQMQLPAQMYDTILFNGTPSYITDLQKSFDKAYQALKSGGNIVVIDVPKESSYAIMYNLAKALDSWEHPLLAGVHPQDPYPIEFVKIANWRTTKEKIEMLEKSGFTNLEFAQTLTKHPLYSNCVKEEPIAGYDCGDYVAICAKKN